MALPREPAEENGLGLDDSHPSDRPDPSEDEVSSDMAITIEGLSKRYRIGRGVGPIPVPSILPWGSNEAKDRSADRDDRELEVADEDDDEEELGEDDQDVEQREADQSSPREIWALRDVSLEVPRGTTLGLIGSNGSGKTTLLKILARITPPTTGTATLRGRVAPVFALASAFMETSATGRENVYLLADLFGVPRHIASECMDQIVEFAELDDLIDTPIKKYSGGGSRRLAFSIVLNLDPDILLVDEVLAGGDHGFYGKCLKRVEEAADAGVSLLFASHELDTVQRFCRQAIWMEEGRIVEHGETAGVIASYTRTAGTSWPEGVEGASLSPTPEETGPHKNEHAEILSAAVFSMDGEPLPALSVREDALIEVEIEAFTPGVEIQCIVVLAGPDTPRVRLVQPQPFRAERGRHVVSVHLSRGQLRDGQYKARAGARLTAGDERSAVVRSSAFTLDVYDPEDREGPVSEDDQGQVDEVVDLAWDVSSGLGA